MRPPHFIHVPHYFPKHLPRPLQELYLSSAIMDLASSAIAIFEPIYLWSLTHSIKQIMVFYLIVYVAYYLLLPLGGMLVARVGHERSILFSTLWYAGYFAALIGLAKFPVLFWIAPLLFAMQKTFYWPAYHFDFLRFAVKEERASEYSGLQAEATLMVTIGPILGGLIVQFLGFPTLFGFAIAAILLSSIPLFGVRMPPKREAYSYWRSFTLPFRRRYLKSTVGYLSLGNELILLAVWPIFILLVFGDMFNVGVLVGISAFLTILVTVALGSLTDHSPKRHILATGGLVTAGIWLLRAVTRIPPFVFLFDLVGRMGYNATVVSITSMTYDRAHEDDYSWHGVYYEQGFAIAKTLMCVAVIALASIVDPFQAAFVLAAIVSLLYLAF